MELKSSDFFKGQLLIAMPGLLDPNFDQTVTLLCEHNDEGALGIVLNRVHPSLSGKDIFEVAKDLETLPLWGFLYTNVEVEGRLQGINPDPISRLIKATSKPVIVSGGITTRSDLELLRGMGVEAAVVGMAIYTGRISFKKVVREFR